MKQQLITPVDDFDISKKLVEQRYERQNYNNKLAYDTIKTNLINPN